MTFVFKTYTIGPTYEKYSILIFSINQSTVYFKTNKRMCVLLDTQQKHYNDQSQSLPLKFCIFHYITFMGD